MWLLSLPSVCVYVCIRVLGYANFFVYLCIHLGIYLFVRHFMSIDFLIVVFIFRPGNGTVRDSPRDAGRGYADAGTAAQTG